jgi:prephenate dehydrogenase
MDVLVVGAGAMGRWLASTLDADVAFADADPEAATAAAAAVDGRAVPLDGEGGDPAERFDIVALAVPVGAVEAAAESQADRAREAVVDVTGVMEPAVAALRSAAPDRERLSLHPLFAPDHAPGRIAAVPDATGATTDAIRDRLEAAGNAVFETTPAEHDRAMETVQAGAHAAVLAFALAAEDVRPAFHTPVSGSLAALAGRVTRGEPDVYADVQATFDGAEAVAAAARRIADADPEAFRELYAEAGANAPRPPDDARDGAGTTGAEDGARSGGA